MDAKGRKILLEAYKRNRKNEMTNDDFIYIHSEEQAIKDLELFEQMDKLNQDHSRKVGLKSFRK